MITKIIRIHGGIIGMMTTDRPQVLLWKMAMASMTVMTIHGRIKKKGQECGSIITKVTRNHGGKVGMMAIDRLQVHLGRVTMAVIGKKMLGRMME